MGRAGSIKIPVCQMEVGRATATLASSMWMLVLCLQNALNSWEKRYGTEDENVQPDWGNIYHEQHTIDAQMHFSRVGIAVKVRKETHVSS